MKDTQQAVRRLAEIRREVLRLLDEARRLTSDHDLPTFEIQMSNPAEGYIQIDGDVWEASTCYPDASDDPGNWESSDC